MSDIICLRKKRSVGSKFVNPTACITFPRGEFRFYNLTLNLMNLDKSKEALMFYLNKKNKTVKVEIEQKEDDNYWLSDAKGYYRFTSKDLAILFSEVLGIEYEGKHYFKVSKLSEKEFKMELITN